MGWLEGSADTYCLLVIFLETILVNVSTNYEIINLKKKPALFLCVCVSPSNICHVHWLLGVSFTECLLHVE